MLTLAQLQVEVREWTDRNFPNAPPHYPLLGIMEEVGELAHAHLKNEEGIRGTPEEHLIAKVDALGDVIVYLAHYAHRSGIDLQGALEVTWNKVKQRDWKKNPKTGNVESEEEK